MNNADGKNREQKKMTSIGYKLHGQLLRTKLGAFFVADIFLFVALSLLWIINLEIDKFGKLDFKKGTVNINLGYERFFTTRGEGLNNLTYVVRSDGKELINENVSTALAIILTIVVIAIIFQAINIIFSYYGEYRRIKKTLKPINDIALRADELSKLSFDNSKYHTIENAIENISPEQTTSLSLGDADLQGIEAAMNNMLERMHYTYLQQARFVNDASHELRTPISVIKGYADMLDRWGKEDEEILDESISAIKNESDHMNHLVEQLLFLARGDAGRNTMTFENVSLNSVMQEIYEESLMIDEKHIYKYNEKAQNVYMQADASMIKQAMRILVDNAAKYTKEGDEIILSVGFTENHVPYIQVQDNGIGMAEVDVKHMFERFYRVDDTRKVQGTGLGLSIAKWIVDQHKGHFEILSRKDIGTRISIIFSKE